MGVTSLTWWSLYLPTTPSAEGLVCVAVQVRGVSFQGAGVTGGSIVGDLKTTGRGRAQLTEA